jgi:hypothetical protein
MRKTSKKGQKGPFIRMARRAGRRRRRNGPHQSGERQSPHRAGNAPENGVSAEVFATFTNMVNDSPCWCPHVASAAPAPRQPFSAVFSARPPFQPVAKVHPWPLATRNAALFTGAALPAPRPWGAASCFSTACFGPTDLAGIPPDDAEAQSAGGCSSHDERSQPRNRPSDSMRGR